MDSISALLEALKRSQSDARGSLPDMKDAKPVAARVSIVKAVPAEDAPDMGDEDMPEPEGEDEGDDAGRNAAIVDRLEQDYPDIYRRLCREVDAGEHDPDEPDGDEMPDLGSLTSRY